MNSRRAKLLSAIKSAESHVKSSTSGNLISNNSNTEKQPPKSKLAKLAGKSEVSNNRKSLLSRVGVKSRPTFELIADGVLGSQSHDYRPKIKFDNIQGDVSSIVAERIKNLRERTLNKISSDSNISEDSFYGFESDGTPIWSSVVNGARAIEAKSHHIGDETHDVTHHHSVHIPIIVNWPKELGYTSHNTFKNWCVVAENKRATQLAEQVVDFTQQSLNPLIIIGDSGVGKSHLLHAIGQSVMLRNDQSIFFVRGDELSMVLAQEQSWTDVFSNSSLLLIDDIDLSLESDEISNALGAMIDSALNMNVHVVVSSKSSPDSWPASKLWDLLRSGVKTIINPVGAGSLLLYARRLAMQKSIVLSDEQLALIVTSGNVGWRSTKNAIDKVEAALVSGVQVIDSIDVYKIMHDIQTDDEETVTELQTESVEDIANRLISSVVDVVYSDHELGGIEINTTLPELSDDYQPPELDIKALNNSNADFVQSRIDSTLDDLTPEAPSVIDVNDRDKHLIAKMSRIIDKDHSIAADILTDLDMGIDEQLTKSNDSMSNDAELLVDLESKLLSLAAKTSNASIEGLIGIADELRALEHELVAIDTQRAELPEFIEDEHDDRLNSYVPDSNWNVDSSQVSIDDLIDNDSTITPIQGTLTPHPEGVIRTSIVTPVRTVLSGEEE
ncbi:MAG: DnaA/Hda family protein [Candidatus Thermoplasmatota archaeon]|nr:DnaA/Hda family protein [Candidatus Thermoplasmatota archaeon]